VGGQKMKNAFIQKGSTEHSTQQLCKMMTVSRSRYYEWRKPAENQREREEKRLMPMIQRIFDDSRQTYGYRRVKDELTTQNQLCGKHRVVSLMKKLRLKAISRRKYRVTTNSNHAFPVFQNVLNRQFNPRQINQSWASDITYISTAQGWLYVAVIMDLYSRQIIGWAMDRRMTDELVKEALRMALYRRKINSSVLLHSDRGSQYASKDYQQLLNQHGIQCSMSRKGNCWDNAPMESFFKTLKVECVYRHSFKSLEQARMIIFDYIEIFYNRQRKHSRLNYLSPVNYELATANL
jgi:putative transposase